MTVEMEFLDPDTSLFKQFLELTSAVSEQGRILLEEGIHNWPPGVDDQITYFGEAYDHHESYREFS